jgi:hypothetical protein
LISAVSQLIVDQEAIVSISTQALLGSSNLSMTHNGGIVVGGVVGGVIGGGASKSQSVVLTVHSFSQGPEDGHFTHKHLGGSNFLKQSFAQLDKEAYTPLGFSSHVQVKVLQEYLGGGFLQEDSQNGPRIPKSAFSH